MYKLDWLIERGLTWLLLAHQLARVGGAGGYGTLSYVSPAPFSAASVSFVSVNVELRLLPEHASLFLSQCGGLVGIPNDQSAASRGCKFRIRQLDLRPSFRSHGSGGIEISSHVSLEMALDESQCNATKHCALTVAIVDSNGHEVVLAPETPLFVVLSERAFDIEPAVSVSSTVIDRFVQKCLGATRGKLGDLSGDVWSRHAQAVFLASASLRGHSMHSYGGHPPGPWLENYWLRYFSSNFELPQFGPFVPIFAQWVDVRFEADRRKVL